MSKLTLANQLGWSITTMDQLNEIGEKLNDSANQYNDIVNQLSTSDYLGEMLDDIQKMNNIFQEDINGLKKHIYNEHMTYIETQIKGIKQSLDAFS
ncbi:MULTISPECIES: hypothetical protein [unclassified Pseudoalteromonas]|uniref:hypothetical protein n=1 Tax=unclassified Pseudoalteromonas TaxID=194690 RepID=UPI0005A8EE07|nr:MULTISPECIES: hypothetical protein [unclassified Pseudoalteromonas]